MATVTKPIALDESLNTTELSSRNVADVLAQELSAVATAIGGIAVPSADHVSYDNSVSGLSATDVQNALDEIVSDIPTVNNGTLTIQQNGTSKGSFTANSASNVNVNIETPTADKKTATDQFTTADGGLLSKCQINLVPVQSGSGDPSPDNVRPISGHTEVDLYNVGKNWIDNTQTPTNAYINGSGKIVASGNDKGVICKVEPNTQYTISYYRVPLSTSTEDWMVGEYTSLPAIGDVGVRSVIKYTASEGLVSATITTLATTKYLFIKIANITITDFDSSVATLQVEKGSTATPFEPYLGRLYQVQIGSTVYGGYVDLVSGVMTVIGAIVDLGTLYWSKDSQSRWFGLAYGGQIPNLKGVTTNDEIANIICSNYRSTSRNNITSGDGICINVQNSVLIADSYMLANYDDAQFKTAMNGVQLVYELSTPQTIQLTPQQIETLAGQNNLSTPLSGQSIETNGVEYKELFTFADVKSYVDKKIPDAPTTDGTYTLQAVVSGGVPTYSWV